MSCKNIWELNVYDQNFNEVFNANYITNFAKGWNALNIQIKPEMTKLKIVFIKYDSEDDGNTVDNYCYFFDSEGNWIHTETLTVKKDPKSEIKRFWIDVPENSTWMNIEIDPQEFSGIFRIPGCYHEEDQDQEIKSEFINNLTYFDDEEDYEIKQNRNKELFHSIKNYQELKESTYDQSTFIPKDSMLVSSSFFTLPEFYPKANQHQIIDPYDPRYLHINCERHIPPLLFGCLVKAPLLFN